MHRRVEFHPLPEGGIQVACNRRHPPRAAKDLPAGIAKNRTEPSRSPCRHPFTRDTAQNYRKKPCPYAATGSAYGSPRQGIRTSNVDG